MNSRMKEIEQKLFNYFNRDKRIRVLNNRLELLRKQISEINYKLEHIDYDLPEESMAIGYDEKVKTSPTGYSFAERTLYNITDRLLESKKIKEGQIANIENTIRDIIADSTNIGDNIELIRDGDREFLKQKYKYGKKDWQLGMEYGISRQAASKRKNTIILDILKWEVWFDPAKR
ncbi:hypothetical protein [Clostridium sp.]|uniref:hypothetical protein n=1 Tax=Clostridium sp. TaxID=1506 RepID=UPI0035A0F685